MSQLIRGTRLAGLMLLTANQANGATIHSDRITPKMVQGVEIEALAPLMGTTVQAVRTPENTFFISQNGRFVFTGRVMDTWSGRWLQDFDDIERYANRIPPAWVRSAIEELVSVEIGAEGPSAIVFIAVDNAVIPQAFVRLKQLARSHQLTVVLVPTSDEGMAHTARIKCALDKDPNTVRDTLLNGEDIERINDPKCGLDQARNTFMTARLLGIKTLPVVIAENGEVLSPEQAPEQAVADLDRWLKQNANHGP